MKKLTDSGQPEQISMFDAEFVAEQTKRAKLSEKHKKLNTAMESICKRYGKDAVVKASDLAKKEAK